MNNYKPSILLVLLAVIFVMVPMLAVVVLVGSLLILAAVYAMAVYQLKRAMRRASTSQTFKDPKIFSSSRHYSDAPIDADFYKVAESEVHIPVEKVRDYILKRSRLRGNDRGL